MVIGHHFLVEDHPHWQSQDSSWRALDGVASCLIVQRACPTRSKWLWCRGLAAEVGSWVTFQARTVDHTAMEGLTEEPRTPAIEG